LVLDPAVRAQLLIDETEERMCAQFEYSADYSSYRARLKQLDFAVAYGMSPKKLLAGIDWGRIYGKSTDLLSTFHTTKS
jgi:hypothetical protein